MNTTVEIITEDRPKPIVFKRGNLYISSRSRKVVLCTNTKPSNILSGVELYADEGACGLGYIADCWDSPQFSEFIGTIEITQK